MSGQSGFVYVLGNSAMPGLFKIGCTRNSPYERARQLSDASGVPIDFEVLCFIEVDGFKLAERTVHEAMANHRASKRREFFTGLERIVEHLYFYPGYSRFVDCVAHTDRPLASRLTDCLGTIGHLDQLFNPWVPEADFIDEVERVADINESRRNAYWVVEHARRDSMGAHHA